MPRLPFDKDQVRRLPTSCGVYIFGDEQGKPLYVGKATDLRSRVRSYFSNKDGRLVSQHIQRLASWMDFLVTNSTKEALILENSLIKKHGPKLNIRLKDDSTYFSLRLDPKDRWPRLTIVRKRKREDVMYFGPYPSARACRRTIQMLTRIFPIRDCPDSVLYNRSRPCISYEIGQCVAPCVGLVEHGSYMELVDRVVQFLSGKDTEVLAVVEAQMHEASEKLEFERAADLRDRLQQMRETIANPSVARRGGPDRDVIGYHPIDDEVSITVLQVRDGLLINSASFAFKILERTPDEVLAAFLGQYYGEHRQPPDEVLLPSDCADLELHRDVLEDLRGAAVILKVPERGEGVRLLRLAEENARFAHRKAQEQEEASSSVLHALYDKLRLNKIPRVMECFDISHLSGEHVVASRVVFRDGHADKSQYRHYRLREVRRNDDFAAMAEILTRRLKRGKQEDDLPDLIVIDGGRPQLNAVLEVAQQVQVSGVEFIGLAKAKSGSRARTVEATYERVFKPGEEIPILLDRDADETHLLSRLRDEAHRFAITFQRRLRGREKVSSVLEMIPGIGRRKAQGLLSHFGSVRGVREASLSDLRAAPGVNDDLAQAIQDWFDLHARDA